MRFWTFYNSKADKFRIGFCFVGLFAMIMSPIIIFIQEGFDIYYAYACTNVIIIVSFMIYALIWCKYKRAARYIHQRDVLLGKIVP